MPWLEPEAVGAGFQTSRVEVRYAHARTSQVAPRFGEIRFQTFSHQREPWVAQHADAQAGGSCVG
jgi:hypothetical protein